MAQFTFTSNRQIIYLKPNYISKEVFLDLENG